MSVNLREIFINTQSTYGLQVVAGEIGLNNIIQWVSRIESFDEFGVDRYSNCNQVLFITSSRFFFKGNKKKLLQYLIQEKSCGLIVIGNEIDEPLEEIIFLCNKNNFPLILMPNSCGIMDIQREYISEIEKDKNTNVIIKKIFTEIIGEKTNLKNHENLLRANGFRFESNYTCTVIYTEDNRKYIELQKMREWNHFLNYALRSLGVSISFPMKQYQVIITKDVDQEIIKKVMKSFVKLLKQNHIGIITKIGIGEEVSGLHDIGISYYSAVAAARKACADSVDMRTFEEIEIFQLLLTLKKNCFLEKFVLNQIGVLIDYDLSNGTHLIETLEKYFSYNSSVNRVAQEMYIHRNTVNKRIGMIKVLLQKKNFDQMEKTCLEIAIIGMHFLKSEAR